MIELINKAGIVTTIVHHTKIVTLADLKEKTIISGNPIDLSITTTVTLKKNHTSTKNVNKTPTFKITTNQCKIDLLAINNIDSNEALITDKPIVGVIKVNIITMVQETIIISFITDQGNNQSGSTEVLHTANNNNKINKQKKNDNCSNICLLK